MPPHPGNGPRRRRAALAGVAGACAAVVMAVAPVAYAPPVPKCDPSLFAGGTGDAEAPYLIATEAQLRQLSGLAYDCSFYNFRQVGDIALTGPLVGLGSGVDGAGTFTGAYDGAGHAITGIDITAPAGPLPAGLFSRLAGADISNLTVSGSVAGAGSVGLLAGDVAGGSVRNVTARGTVATSGLNGGAGGLLGTVYASSGTAAAISGVSVDANIAQSGPAATGGAFGVIASTLNGRVAIDTVTVTGAITNSGGGTSGALAGQIYGADASRIVVERVIARAAITAQALTGGMVGTLGALGIARVTVRDASVSGTVSSQGPAGGLVGGVLLEGRGQTSVQRAASTVSVTGGMFAGGLIGYQQVSGEGQSDLTDSWTSGTVVATTGNAAGVVGAGGALGSVPPRINRVYAVGRVSAPDGAAGVTYPFPLPGALQSVVSASFWDVESTGQAEGGNAGALGRTTAQMQDIATFTAPGVEWPIVQGWVPSDPANGKVWGICSSANGGLPFLLGEYASSPCPAPPAPPAPAPSVGTIPGVKWRARGTVVAGAFAPVAGASRYSVVAGRTANGKAGKASTARVQNKAGTCRVTKARVACTVTLAPGRWRVTLRASSAAALVATTSRAFRLRPVKVIVTG